VDGSGVAPAWMASVAKPGVAGVDGEVIVAP
jgi:hypothetical protein